MFKRVSKFLARSDRRHNPAFLLADESGSATVETVLWLPLIFLIFGFAIDFSMVFFGRSQALRVIQDANRNYSIGRLTNGAEIKTYVESRLASLSPSATAVPEFDSGVVKTTVSMPASELEMLGLFRGIDTFTVSVSAEHMMEYWES